MPDNDHPLIENHDRNAPKRCWCVRYLTGGISVFDASLYAGYWFLQFLTKNSLGDGVDCNDGSIDFGRRSWIELLSIIHFLIFDLMTI